MKNSIVEIKRTKKLEDLFKLWKKEQLEDNNNTGFFVEDGYIDENKYCKSKKKILFLLKEANILQYVKNDNPLKIKNDCQKYFYLDFEKEKYKYKKESLKVDFVRASDNNPKQKEKIARMAKFILEKSNDKKASSKYDELKDSLFKVSFMNLNKMGGYSRSNNKALQAYYEKYREYILQEINILDPDIIVFMVNNDEIKKDINQYLKENKKDKKIKILSMLHTAAIGRNLNLSEDEEKYSREKILKKYNFDYVGKGEFIQLNESTKRYLIKFIYRFETGD